MTALSPIDFSGVDHPGADNCEAVRKMARDNNRPELLMPVQFQAKVIR